MRAIREGAASITGYLCVQYSKAFPRQGRSDFVEVVISTAVEMTTIVETALSAALLSAFGFAALEILSCRRRRQLRQHTAQGEPPQQQNANRADHGRHSR